MRSESTRAFGQPRLTKPTLGFLRDMDVLLRENAIVPGSCAPGSCNRRRADANAVVHAPRTARTSPESSLWDGNEKPAPAFALHRQSVLICINSGRPRNADHLPDDRAAGIQRMPYVFDLDTLAQRAKDLAP